MATWGTPKRNIRIPDAVWDEARRIAAERGESLQSVVQRALEEYIRVHGTERDEP